MGNSNSNFIGRRSVNTRKNDSYQTPYSMTDQYVQVCGFDFSGTILEPASGQGAMVKVLQKYFKPDNVKYYDLKDGPDYNFLHEDFEFDHVITNPPFSLAFEFIQKAKDVATKKFSMLLPLNYLHGQKRYEQKIFRDENYPLTKVFVFTRYPLLTDEVREDGKYNTGMQVYAFYEWTKKTIDSPKIEHPTIHWIDNDDFVLKSRKHF
ncbi:MAG: hypothetical protein ABSG25_09250 [Bryobacteraceae bacterium]